MIYITLQYFSFLILLLRDYQPSKPEGMLFLGLVFRSLGIIKPSISQRKKKSWDRRLTEGNFSICSSP